VRSYRAPTCRFSLRNKDHHATNNVNSPRRIYLLVWHIDLFRHICKRASVEACSYRKSDYSESFSMQAETSRMALIKYIQNWLLHSEHL
jgi:hypothetical protein